MAMQSNYIYIYDKLYLSEVEPGSSSYYLKINGTSGTVERSSSTRRSKMNIVDMTTDSSKIYNLVPKSFNYRKYQRDSDGAVVKDSDDIPQYSDESNGVKSLGYIAEDVVTEIPDLVSIDSTGVPDGVDYMLLSVLLVEELKKLEARVKTLEGG